MLSVCATPIGNLEDVTLRVLRELREVDVILAPTTPWAATTGTRAHEGDDGLPGSLGGLRYGMIRVVTRPRKVLHALTCRLLPE